MAQIFPTYGNRRRVEWGLAPRRCRVRWFVVNAWSIVVLAFLFACASNDAERVGSRYDPLLAFPAEATWSWDEAANELPQNERLRTRAEDVQFEPLLREVVEQELAERGYRAVPADQPVNYRLSYRMSGSTRLRPEEYVAVYSVSLLLVEAASKRGAWQGWMSAEVVDNPTPEERRARLVKKVEKMLAEFPPGS